MSIALETEYNGKPLLKLTRGDDDKYTFQFGVRKAQMILDHINDIRAFVDKHARTPAQVG